MITLRDGTTTQDRRLDRLQEFDERSREFNIRSFITGDLKTKTWQCKAWLDQGWEGACVGFSWSHAASSYTQHTRGITDKFAEEKVYWEAQKIDPWPGGAYPGGAPHNDGTSVLAGAKIMRQYGFIDTYRWAFNIDDVLLTLSNHGVVVIGIWWKDSMFHPKPNGLLDISGSNSGGHAILVRGHSLKRRFAGEGEQHVVRLRNSWGRSWGVDGDCFLKVEDLETLLNDDGEACIPVNKHSLKTLP